MANWTSVEITKIVAVPFSARGVTRDDIVAAYTITAVYSCDDGRTLEITDNYDSMESFQDQARKQLDTRNRMERAAPVVGVVDLSPPAPKDPPAPELIAAQAALNEKLIAFQKITQEAQVRARNDQAELAALADLKAAQAALDAAKSADAAAVIAPGP